MTCFLRSLASLGSFATLLVACSAGLSDGSSSESRTRLTPRTVHDDVVASCRNIATSICGRLAECSAGTLTEIFGTRPDCEDAVLGSCVLVYDGPGAAATVAPCDASSVSCEKMRGLFSAGAIGEFPADVLVHECPITPGRFADGESCLRHGDCEGRACATTSGSCGVCRSAGIEGAECRWTTECATGLRCAGRRCVVPRLAGEPCNDGLECAWGSCIAGVCTPHVAADEPCDEEGPLCDRGLALACAPDRTCKPFTVDLDGDGSCDRLVFSSPDASQKVCPWRVEESYRPPCDASKRCPSPSDTCVNGRCTRGCSAS